MPQGVPKLSLPSQATDECEDEPSKTSPAARWHRDGNEEHGEGNFGRLMRELGMEHTREAAESGQLRRELEALRQLNASLLRRLECAHPPSPVLQGDGGPPAVRCLPPDAVDTWEEDAGAEGARGTSTPGGTSRDGAGGKAPSAPEGSQFVIKPDWLEEMDSDRVLRSKQQTTFIQKAAVVRQADESANRILRRVISHPSSPQRLVWEALGAVLIFYDLFAIPLTLAFQPPQTTITELADWSTLTFWTLNIFASFLVGFVRDGVTHMSPAKIAVHYLATWFAVDLVVVIPDWAVTIAVLGKPRSAGGKSVRLLRALRLVRMVRLLRAFKLRALIQNLDELIDTEHVGIATSIAKMIVLLVVITHYIGCAWFLLGESAAQSSSASWVTVHGFDTANWGYKYFTSFHWAITQFTPASMNVQPQNVAERTFAIAVVILALVGFSYVVGSITGSLTQLRSMRQSTSKQFWSLRRCLKQNQIPLALSARVQRYLEHSCRQKQETMSTDGIPLIKLLSEQLAHEFKSQMFVPQISVHPLFHHVCTMSTVTAGRLASDAIKPKPLAQTDCFFLPGETATHMTFIRRGMLQYSKVNSEGVEEKEWVDKREDWIAEPVLWLSCWVHLGRLTANLDCDMILLDPNEFFKIIRLSPEVFQFVSKYARNFLAWLNETPPDKLSDISQGECVGSHVGTLMGVESHSRCGSRSSTLLSLTIGAGVLSRAKKSKVRTAPVPL